MICTTRHAATSLQDDLSVWTSLPMQKGPVGCSYPSQTCSHTFTNVGPSEAHFSTLPTCTSRSLPRIDPARIRIRDIRRAAAKSGLRPRVYRRYRPRFPPRRGRCFQKWCTAADTKAHPCIVHVHSHPLFIHSPFSPHSCMVG